MRRKLIISLVGILVIAYGALLLTIVTDSKPSLGLDLQGGISVTQQSVNGLDCSDSSMKLAVEKIRERIDSLGVAEPEILCQGDTIVTNLPGVKNQEQAIQLVQVTGQVYLRPVTQGCTTLNVPNPTDTTTGGSDSTTGDTTGTTTGGTAGVDTTAATGSTTATSASGGPARAVAASNTTSPDTTTAPSTLAASDTTAAGSDTTTGDTTQTSAVPVDANGLPRQESDPTKEQILPVFGTTEYCYVGPAQGTGQVFSDNATATIITGQGWGVVVDLRGGSAGEDVWNNLASQCYSKQSACAGGEIAIDLDGELQMHATVQTPEFLGSVQISGSFTESDAKNLSRVLNSGSLPVKLQVQSVQNVSASLGKDSLRAAVISGAVGVLLVLIFMAFYYRTLGLIVALGITVSGSLLWGIVTWLSKSNGLALSLSGIAGIIVSVGVTVDSYVVFFERLKDEVRSGRTLRNSATRGFEHAWRTIVIADLVSLLGALVLWYLTVGAVRGFAFFLGLSTACDMVVAYFFTRPTVLLLARTKWMERRKVMGIEVTPHGATA